MTRQELSPPFPPLRISPGFAVERCDDSLLLTSEAREVFYSDPLLVRAVEAMAAGTLQDAGNLEPAIQRLIDDGVVSRASGSDPATVAYWEGLSKSADGSAVSCLCLVPGFERMLAGGLAANGLTVVSDAPLLVVAVDDYL